MTHSQGEPLPSFPVPSEGLLPVVVVPLQKEQGHMSLILEFFQLSQHISAASGFAFQMFQVN